MTKQRPLPNRTPQAEAGRAARLEREAAALRANLAKRKARQRAAAEAEPQPSVVPPKRLG